MTDLIVTVLNANIPSELPRPSVQVADSGTEVAYLTSSVADWSGVTHTVVGGWDESTGEPTQVIDSAYNDWIRPLGNEGGMATGNLDSTRWQGHSEGKFYDTEQRRYPLTNMPFDLRITREDHTSDPVWPGWGWRVDMISDDPDRDITARGIGIYNENWVYLYTSGSFVDDGSGNYYTECPIGQRQPTDAPVYFALLLGSAQEGRWVQPDGAQEAIREFWSNDQ